ncbi:MAG: nucleotidyltransferase domain-containing protein [Nitrosomonadales bacterium]|nr:nucleotidyltransferase domain-containing protein [Nitrosomonadales bacterium]
MRFIELSLSAQTAYMELLNQAQMQELARSAAHLNGNFAVKQVKGHTYWYFAYRDIDGAVRQLYVGPDEERVRNLIERFREDKPREILPLVRSAMALGCDSVVPQHFRVVRRLSEYGFFRAGGVLVGTHALLCIGNSLGIRFTDGARTLDMDFAHAGRNISLALPSNIRVDVEKALDSLEMGFLPISAFHGGGGGTYLNPKNPEFRLDFLTPISRKGGSIRITNLNVALQGLKFMEFSLEEATQAVLLCNEGAVVVNIPSPPRFAIHKLIVYGERKGEFRLKAHKDLLQAAALIEYLSAHRTAELRLAWEDALSRGAGWRKRAMEGFAALTKLQPPVSGLDVLG